MQLACRIVYSIFSSDCVCEYGIRGGTGTPLKILTALQVLSLPKRHKQVVSTNWAKYHQTGQADTRWKPVWKWRERDAKLCHEAAAFKAVPFENHPITVSSADYSKKNQKSGCVRWVSAYLTGLTFHKSSILTSLQEVLQSQIWDLLQDKRWKRKFAASSTLRDLKPFRRCCLNLRKPCIMLIFLSYTRFVEADEKWLATEHRNSPNTAPCSKYTLKILCGHRSAFFR